MSKRPIRLLATVAGILLASAPAHAVTDEGQPPASPAPVASPGGQPDLTRELADARRSLIEAEQELREANAALARTSRDPGADAEALERASERQQEAQAAFEAARSQLPELMVRARAAGMSTAALRAYQHSLYGD